MTRLFLSILLIIVSFFSTATHIIGGFFEVSYIYENNFEIRLLIYGDCQNGSVNSFFSDIMTINLYEQESNNQIQTFYLTKQLDYGPINRSDNCTSLNYCIEEFIFIDTVHLDNNPNGYYLTWETCCRNGAIVNLVDPLSSGSVFYIDIPDPLIKNNSPKFGGFPESPYFCTGRENTHNLYAIDPDGDSLVYELITPYDGNCTNCPPPKPFLNCQWQAPFSTIDPFGCSVAPYFDAVLGILSSKPNYQGLFVISYQVSEYRNSQKIGVVTRDFEFISTICTPYTPSLTDNLIINSYPGEETCFDIIALDPTHSNINLQFENNLQSIDGIELSQGNSNSTGQFTLESIINNNQTTIDNTINYYTEDSTIFYTGTSETGVRVCLYPTCDNIDSTIDINFYAYGEGCNGSDTIKSIIKINVLETGKILQIPNVFTPNNDIYNDIWFVDEICHLEWTGVILNRWGNIIKEIDNENNSWDGFDRNGNVVTEGVYFCRIITNSGEQYQSPITLIR